MFKTIALAILEDFAQIVEQGLEMVSAKEPMYKEVCKFESLALLFWLFNITAIFPKEGQKLILDYMHEKYYSKLRKAGYTTQLLQAMTNDFNIRYSTYGDSFRQHQDLTRIAKFFLDFVSERSKTEVKLEDIELPLFLIGQTVKKMEEYKKITV